MPRTILPALVAAAVLVTGCAAGQSAPRERRTGAASVEVDATRPVVKRGRVTTVVDGDTIDVRLPSGAVKRVRLLGIDTPEVYGTVECGGPEASAWTKRFLPVDTRVELVSDPSQARTDQYDRQLRYVTKLSTGADVNRKIVARGWARLFVWRDDPFQRVASYRTALRAAKEAGRGIWGLC